MDDFISSAGKFAGFVLLIIFIIPTLINIAIVEWIGNYTDSYVVYIMIQIIIGILFLAIAAIFGGWFFGLVFGASGVFYLVLGIIFVAGVFTEGFDYSLYDNLDNWNPPASIEKVD